MKLSKKTLLIIIIFCFMLPCQVLARDIDIGLVISKEKIKIGSNQNATLINLFTKKEIGKITKQETYTIHNSNGLISISSVKSNITLGAFTGPIKLIPEDKKGLVFCNKNWYRGELLILTNSNKKNLTLVNRVNLEDYLLSVVPAEIPNHWSKEALKAQAIAARSYTLGYLGRRKAKGYDLESTVEDQVYLGVGSERKSTSDTVKETKGEVLLTFDGKPLIALYHSSGGGYTDSIENLWDQKPSIHIQPRPDYDDNSPYFKWFRKYSLQEINKHLSHLNIGNIKEITALSRSRSQRVMWLEIAGENKKAKIRGEDFRRAIKLPSSKFNLAIKNDVVYFAGRGHGHGLGLSQWGSKALAEKGFTYKDILSHYYPGVKLVTLDEKAFR